MKHLMTALLISGLAFSGSALAAKPLKMAVVEKFSVDGEQYRHYKVACSDKTKRIMTSRDNGKTWCVGGHSTSDCTKRMVKTAARTCKADITDEQRVAAISAQ